VRRFTPAQLLSLHIVGLVVLGGILLSLPAAAAPGRHVSVLDAFFTSTSAVCVTGLIVVDTPNEFSLFGQIVILLLVQLGGLGYMTISTVVVAAFGRRVTLQERLTLADALNIQSMDQLLRFAGTVAVLTLALELVGAAVLTLRFSMDHPWGHAAWLGLFHAVSAFNNAGFSLFSDSLMGYRGDVTVNLAVSALIILGGLGFLVISEVLHLRRSDARPGLSTHTRFVLSMTACLLVTGTIVILALEWYNPRTLGSLPLGERLLAAWFQSVSPRTAGFNTVDIGVMTTPALFFIIVLMFVGGSPGSTGGGVKTTTFGITVASIWATVRGRSEIVIFKRRISTDTVDRAFAVSLIAFLAVNAVAGVLLISEGRDLLRTLFEATSAFGTVGLSMGQAGSVVSLAAFFSPLGKLLVMAMMFMGRVGPLTLAVALAGRGSAPRVRYPEGKVMIG
jgi:trk system potassium uptake protein TrkH